MKGNKIVKYIFIIFVIAIMGFAIYTVNKEEKTKEEPTQNTTTTAKEDDEIGKELTLGIAEYDTINPILSNNKYVQEISKTIYDSLLDVTDEYKIEKNLLKDWAKTSETTYLLKLRDDIKWSDGQKLTIDDVIYTIDILKNIPSIYSYNVQYVIRTDTIDENTIQLTLDHEIPFFEYNLIFPIMSKKYYEGQVFYNTEKNNMPVGTGKYKIIQNNDNEIILAQNDQYTRSNLTLEKITIGKYSSLGELYNAFKLGKIDLITTTNENIQNNIGTMGYNIKEVDGREFDFIALNTQNQILEDKEVRKAISYAINRENIIGTIYNNKYKISYYPLDYGSYLNGDESGISYNTNKAIETLENAGWEVRNGKWQKVENYRTKTINLKLVVQESNQSRSAIADMIKASLEEINIKVTLIKANDNLYQTYLQNKNYDMILTGVSESANPNLALYFGADNLANYNNDEINQIMSEVKNITKEEMLIEKYKSVKEIYNEEIPYIGLYNSYYAIISSWNLKGNISGNWYNIFKDIDNWYKN